MQSEGGSCSVAVIGRGDLGNPFLSEMTTVEPVVRAHGPHPLDRYEATGFWFEPRSHRLGLSANSGRIWVPYSTLYIYCKVKVCLASLTVFARHRRPPAYTL